MKLLLSLSLLTAFAASADDWPQWRGPNRDGISKETGLLKQWPDGGPMLAWKATGLGDSYTSPSVSGGRIFGMGLFEQDESVWALDAATGKLVWKMAIGEPPRLRAAQGGFGPRGTPTIDGDRVYVIGAGGTAACLEAASGKILWTKSLVTDFGGAPPTWGFSESPLVDGDRVLATPGGSSGTIVALNKKTGETLWQTKGFTDKAEYSSVVPAQIGGVKQYVQLTGASVAGIKPDNGEVLWRAQRQGKTATIPTPVVNGDLVYVTSGYGVGCNLFKVTKDSSGFKAEQVYANTDMKNHHGGVLQIGGYIYGSSDQPNALTCMDLKTGDVKWAERSVGKGSLTCAGGLLIHRAEGKPGTVTLIEPSPDGFKKLGQFDQPDRSGKPAWPHPVVANGKLYLRDMDIMLCYDIKQK